MLTSWILAASLALAPASDFSWSVQPSGPQGPTGRDYFTYTATPGQQVRDTVGITNRSDRKLTFRLYATDAFNTGDGAFALLTADRQPVDVGTWISLEKSTLTVKPGKRVDVPFTLKVPANATPGDHSGGVLAAVTEQETTSDGRRLNVDRRVAARVHLRVAGPLTSSLQVDRISADHSGPVLGKRTVKVTYRVRNNGNVRLAGDARVYVHGPLDWPQGSPAEREIPELLPGSSYTFTDTVSGVLPAGPMQAAVRLTPTDPGGVSPSGPALSTRTSGLWMVPWTGLGVLALFLLLPARRRRPARR